MTPPRIERLYHVTLTSGHVSYTERRRVDPGTIRLLRRSLIEAMDPSHAGQRVPVPGRDGHSYNVTAGPAGLIATVWTTIDNEPVPAVIFGVAPRPDLAEPLWRALHAPYEGPMSVIPFRTDIDAPPSEPWLAARIEAGIAGMSPTDQMWLGKFEAQLAWTWIDSTESVMAHYRPKGGA